MTVTSGRRCLELYRKSDPVGLLVRMSLDLFELRLTKFFPGFQKPDMKHGRIVAKLGMSAGCSEEKESLLWPRPTTGAPPVWRDGEFSPNAEITGRWDYNRGGAEKPYLWKRWEFESRPYGVAHGVPSRVDRLKCLGNAVVPQQFYPIFRGIAELEEMYGNS